MAKVNIKYTCNILIIISILFFYITTCIMAEDAQSYYENGYQYFSQGDFQKAEENYQKAIELDANFEDANYWLGKVYRQIGQYDKAILQWIKVLKINPRNPYAFRYLNDSFRSTSRIQNGTANDYFDEGIKLLKIDNGIFINENMYNNHELLQVIPYFKKAIDLKADFVAAHYWLAEIYQALSKKISWQYTSMAINNFENAIQAEEKNRPNSFNRPSEYWYSYQELIAIFQSLGLNERKEGILEKLYEIKENPYKEILSNAGYSNLGYPDKIEIISQEDKLIEVWEFTEEGKKLRVVDKEIIGEEINDSMYKRQDALIINEGIEEDITEENES